MAVTSRPSQPHTSRAQNETKSANNDHPRRNPNFISHSASTIMNGHKPPQQSTMPKTLPIGMGKSNPPGPQAGPHLLPHASSKKLPLMNLRNKFNPQEMKNHTKNPIHPLCGGSIADTDSAYCAEVARRSVARAALHLGIEGMEGLALDALGGVLLSYMESVGTTISSMVETSGRSSAHTNAYDALNAVESCTAPAAAHLGLAQSLAPTAPTMASAKEKSINNNSSIDNQNRNRSVGEYQGRGWEGLASFLFGPDWYSIPLLGEDDAASGTSKGSTKHSQSISNGSKHGAEPKKGPGGKTILPKMPKSVDGSTLTNSSTLKGKQLPNLAAASSEKNVSFSMDRRPNLGKGIGVPPIGPGDIDSANNVGFGRWDAPYLGPVPPFPLVRSIEHTANPHRLMGTHAALSLHDLAMEVEACRDMSPFRGPRRVADDSGGLGPLTKRPRKGNFAGGESNSSVGGLSDGTKHVPVAKIDSKSSSERTNYSHSAETARMAEERAMRETIRIPDETYLASGKFWGCIDDEGKSPATNTGAFDYEIKPNVSNTNKPAIGTGAAPVESLSKVRFDPLSKPPSVVNTDLKLPGSSEFDSSEASSIPVAMPSYVPNFFPPFPAEIDRRSGQSSVAASAVLGEVLSRASSHRDKRKYNAEERALLSTSTSALPLSEEDTVITGKRDSVRRSVIQLGKSTGSSYWGSGFLSNETADVVDGDRLSLSSKSPSLAVAPGVSAGSDLTANAAMKEVVGSSTVRKAGLEASQVVPLGRASGSRVSKILEGSMNIS